MTTLQKPTTAAYYEAALQRIIEANPEWIGPSEALVAEAEACFECKRNRDRNWPPSGLCDPHYRKFDDVERANDNRRRYFASVLRDIAREALESAP